MGESGLKGKQNEKKRVGETDPDSNLSRERFEGWYHVLIVEFE